MICGYSIYLALIVSLLSLQQAKGCAWTEMHKVNGVCSLALQCDRQISFDPYSVDCLITQDSDYETYYATDFLLYVTIENAYDEYDIFEQIEKPENIEELNIAAGYINVIPQKVFQLTRVKKFLIINNRLSVVNLNKFSTLSQVTTIILRNDSIASLEMGTQTLHSSSRSIQKIDLSHNLLESIPNTCFSLFKEMKYLNLSHNMIRSLDILTFGELLGLRTLDVSLNKLFEIGHSFTRLMNLKELYLQNNNLTKISDYNLSKLIQMQKLNLSSNFIDGIENKTFKSLLHLEYLDVSNNKIGKITKLLFKNNSNLRSLILTNNNISYIEDGSFDGKNITEFNIKYNRLNKTIEQDTFKGIHVTELDLSNGYITSLGNESFYRMSGELSYVNVSCNKITSISRSAFNNLELLSTLDLSHNLLEELTFETSSLINLKYFYPRNNNIEILTKSVFDNLPLLTELDLSDNKINKIELKCFLGLKNVKKIIITNNPFVNTLKNNAFEGLINLETIDLSYTRTTSYQNESFSGLPNLRHLNSSYGLLSAIEYNAFSKTGSIEILDLSHNLLENFHVNTSNNQNIEEIYLNDNAIRLLKNNTFSGFKKMRILNLGNNAISKMEVNALGQLHQLSHLSFSANTQMEIIGESFNNLPNLYQVSLDNIKTRFTFQNASAQMINLDLRFCGITDLSKLFIYNVKKLQELNLCTNSILTVDKFSFQDMPFLIKLDLSLNRINCIQPGSFKHVSYLRSLNLFGNNLQMLQFGTFDGARVLSFVNLSSNALQSFDPRLLPLKSTLALDNNNINELAFLEFFNREIKKLSIGGNPISCNVFLELINSPYSEEFKSVISTASLDFHSENVDGISCQSASKKNGLILPNTTSFDVRPAFNQLTKAIQDMRSSIDLLNQNESQDKSHQLKTELIKIVNSIQNMVNISSQSQKNTNKFLKNIEDLTNNSQIYFKEFVLQLINQTGKENPENSENFQGIVSSKDSGDTSIEMKKMLKDEIAALRAQFDQSLQKRGPDNQAQITEKDDKVFYFIAAPLWIIIVLYIINVAYKFIKQRRIHISRNLHGSTRPIASDMEME